MRPTADLTRWPTWLLVLVAVVAVGANVPPLERLSVAHGVLAACAAFGFGSALWQKQRRADADR